MGADMKITTVQQLRDLDPEKVTWIEFPEDRHVLPIRLAQMRMWSDASIEVFLPATPLVPMQDTHEPPADDGYVSRNVYDYDEPEPPSDVREALALDLSAYDQANNAWEWADMADYLASLGYVRIDPTDEAQVEKVAKAVKPLFSQAGLVDLDADDYSWDAARAVLAALRGGA